MEACAEPVRVTERLTPLASKAMGASTGPLSGELDPRTKLVLTFCFGMAYFTAVDIGIWLEALGCAFSLLLLASTGRMRTVTGFCGFFSFTYLVQFTLIPLLGPDSVVGLVLSMIFVIFRKFVPPFIVLTWLIVSTKTAHLISALMKMRVPQGPTIALAVLFRFFPTVFEQFQAIRGAMRLKGIPLTLGSFFSHPLRTFEYCVVPLMSSSLRIGSELSCAALCRGLGYSNRRTSIVEARLRTRDYLCIAVCVGGLAMFMVWRANR